MKGGTSKGLCIAVVALLIATAASYVITANASAAVKVYNGPKEVYREIGAKGRPSWLPPPPGQVNEEPTPEPDPSIDKWAVVIGISDYRGRVYDLQYCDDDAKDMYNYLLAKGYPQGNIKLLLDKNAKASVIMDAIDWLNSWEGLDSEVVFFYSGHGSTYDGYDDGDTEYTDEAIVSTDLYLILDGQLRQKFSTFDSQKISFTFDTCFSGGMDDLVGAWTGTTITGRIVVAACDEEQYSYEASDLKNGVFTYYYVGTDESGLQTYNTVEGAFEYAAPLAHEYMTQHEYEMDPQMYDQYSGDWAF